MVDATGSSPPGRELAAPGRRGERAAPRTRQIAQPDARERGINHLGPVALLLLARLAEAGRVLERGEAGGGLAAARARAEPARGGDRGRGADDAAEHERAEPSPSAAAPVLFHATIVLRWP